MAELSLVAEAARVLHNAEGTGRRDRAARSVGEDAWVQIEDLLRRAIPQPDPAFVTKRPFGRDNRSGAAAGGLCGALGARRDELRASLASLGVSSAPAHEEAAASRALLLQALGRCVSDRQPLVIVSLGCSFTEGLMACALALTLLELDFDLFPLLHIHRDHTERLIGTVFTMTLDRLGDRTRFLNVFSIGETPVEYAVMFHTHTRCGGMG